jgi:hypothetical protein
MAEHLLAPQGSTSEIVRVEWGVMDDDCRVTECPNGHDAREHQATHGGGAGHPGDYPHYRLVTNRCSGGHYP